MFAVIMAGGGGTRLWPKSRERFPKQMHALTGIKPLVQESADILGSIVGEENVFIIANAAHARSIAGMMPSFAKRVFIDPYRRDTAPAVGLAAIYLRRVDPDSVLGIFPADHFIGAPENFAEVVRTAGTLAKSGRVVTIGVKPSSPETGYGYIEMDDFFDKVDGHDIYKVQRFVEKPSKERANEYLAAGNYLWNSGMYAWSVRSILELFEKYLPDTYAGLMRIDAAIGEPDEEEVLDREYREINPISIDYGIMEKLTDILVIPGSFGWNDIGSWTTVAEISPKDENGNAIQCSHVAVDTKNCLIVGGEGKIVATIGVEDLIIVDTEDALLVCRKDRAQDVKKIVQKLKEGKLEGYL
jgi:mannose-1-phosphate guanylyltransferase